MWKIQVLLCGTFWNFFPDVFDLWLVERADAGPVDMEGQLYTKRKVCFFWGLISMGTLDSEVLGITWAEGWVFTHCGGGFSSAGSRALFCAVLRGARAGTDGVGCSPEWIKAGKGGSEALGKRTGGQVWGVRWCHSWPFPPEDGIWVGTKESYFGVTLQEPREAQSGVWDRRSFLDETWLMANDVRFVISEEEGWTSGPETGLAHSGLLCGGSFITVKQGTESFW